VSEDKDVPDPTPPGDPGKPLVQGADYNDYYDMGTSLLDQALTTSANPINAVQSDWQSFAKKLHTYITDKVGVSLDNAIAILGNGWTGEASPPFMKRVSEVRSYGMQILSAASLQAGGGGTSGSDFDQPTWTLGDSISRMNSAHGDLQTSRQGWSNNLGQLVTQLGMGSGHVASLGVLGMDEAATYSYQYHPAAKAFTFDFQWNLYCCEPVHFTGTVYAFSDNPSNLFGPLGRSTITSYLGGHGTETAELPDAPTGVRRDWYSSAFPKTYQYQASVLLGIYGLLGYAPLLNQFPSPPKSPAISANSSSQNGNGSSGSGGSNGFSGAGLPGGYGGAGVQPGSGFSGVGPGTINGSVPNGTGPTTGSGFTPPPTTGSGLTSPATGSGFSGTGGQPGSTPTQLAGFTPGQPGAGGAGLSTPNALSGLATPTGFGGAGGSALTTPGAFGGAAGGLGGGLGSTIGGTAGESAGALGAGAAGTAADSALGAGASAAAAGRGMPMMPPMMPPMGMGNSDKDRQRKSWLPEDEDIWGGDGTAVPPVISGDA
jgi:hypothetical protein